MASLNLLYLFMVFFFGSRDASRFTSNSSFLQSTFVTWSKWFGNAPPRIFLFHSNLNYMNQLWIVNGQQYINNISIFICFFNTPYYFTHYIISISLKNFYKIRPLLQLFFLVFTFFLITIPYRFTHNTLYALVDICQIIMYRSCSSSTTGWFIFTFRLSVLLLKIKMPLIIQSGEIFNIIVRTPFLNWVILVYKSETCSSYTHSTYLNISENLAPQV